VASSRVKVTGKRQITLPIAVCQALGIERGDELEIEPEARGILLRRRPGFPPLSEGSSLFKHLGAATGPGGPGAEDHHHLLGEEAAGDERQ